MQDYNRFIDEYRADMEASGFTINPLWRKIEDLAAKQLSMPVPTMNKQR